MARSTASASLTSSQSLAAPPPNNFSRHVKLAAKIGKPASSNEGSLLR
jgi:hypothetical protein